MADKTRGRTERNHAKYVFQAALYFTPVTCYNRLRHWYAYRDSLNIHRTSNKGTKCQDIVLKCQAWERKKGKTSLWPLRREESRGRAERNLSAIFCCRGFHVDLYIFSFILYHSFIRRWSWPEIGFFGLSIDSLICVMSSVNYVKCKKHEVWSVETVTGSTSVILYTLLTMTRVTVKTLHTSTLATAPSSRHLVQNKMNLDGWNDNFNCGVLVCIINKEVRYKTPPNGWSGGGWRCGPHFTFPHQTRVHWFVSPPRLGAWPVAMSSSGSAGLSHSW